MMTVGMVIHLYLSAGVVLRRTANPIWGELWAVLLLQPIFVLWGLLAVLT